MLLSQLKYLTALAKERHFARAAQACHVSQPALSTAIRRLEAEFRVPIVRRSNRFIGFTHEGERIVAWAQRVLAEHDTLVENVRSLREGLSGRLRIGAIPTTLSSISLITRAFCELHPLVTLSVVSMTSQEIERALVDYQIDVGLTYVDNEPLENVRRQSVYRERYALLTDERGLLNGRDTLTWAEAAEVPLCLLSPDMQNRRIVDRAFRRAGVEAVPRVETNSVSALCSYVHETRWSAVMPHAWLALHAVPEGMRAIPLVEPEVSKEIGLVVADRDPEPVLARALMDTVAGADLQARLDLYHPSGPQPSEPAEARPVPGSAL
ncbi:LysR family transcriptional regulator [Nocardiopsis sp. NPDC006938]|uniref:LysR family transcriptional regulator n=1 Tax=Nocardiopsis sp. NPDC006938 TaxID=3364337 RepID=UPI003699FBAD